MQIRKIEIKNYRLLKDFSIDLEKELSLIIGKNNTGKTAILGVLSTFLDSPSKDAFSIDDFNLDSRQKLESLIENEILMSEQEYKQVEKQIGISIRLFIEYTTTDNLSNIGRVMMDLDPNNNYIVLGFEYALDYDGYSNMQKKYQKFKQEEDKRQKKDNPNKHESDLLQFLRQYYARYFSITKRSLAYDPSSDTVNEDIFLKLDNEKIDNIINFKNIKAKRDVANKEIDKTLSGQTSRIYKQTAESDQHREFVKKFQDQIKATDSRLNEIYQELFSSTIEKVKKFGGIRLNETEIEIISTLKQQELLAENTTVMYKHAGDNKLPEHHNGLGYMNLINIIFEIEILRYKFKKGENTTPADINLLFIEEPEAHTHPQMQYVFIKNIKKLLSEFFSDINAGHRNLQYIISTHSACIVADSDFEDIKYLQREEQRGVIVKNLKNLKDEYASDTEQYQFLKQYLTVSRAEIFFADKAVLIEGSTERLLLPAFMNKIDIEANSSSGEREQLPLLSQNISIIEIGAYTHIFEKFIDFLGIKTLIITDIDTIDKERKKCKVSVATDYSNQTLKTFFGSPDLNDLKSFDFKSKLFNKIDGKWTNQSAGMLCVVYQTAEGYHARSFEDAFIHINKDFISNNANKFTSMQHSNYLKEEDHDAYDLAEKCIKKKTHFALDILYSSDSTFSNWKIPAYIKEGLLWLQKDHN